MVLVDTAGRMQDNAPLMTALAKLIAVNMPDLVLFVGEALVGNEAVDQLVRQKKNTFKSSEKILKLNAHSSSNGLKYTHFPSRGQHNSACFYVWICHVGR